MKIEDRLRRELTDTAEHLVLDVDTYEHVLDLGRRRRRFHQLAATAGAAALIASVVGVLVLVSPGPPAPIVASSTTTTSAESAVASTSTSSPPSGAIPATEGVLLATPEDGISIVGFDGTTGRLASDRHYESIAWVISDGAGGIIFQHEVTPLPWAQGTILHLPAAATNPVEVVVPDPGTYLRPLDVDEGLLIYRVDIGGASEVRAIDLVTRATRPLIPATEFLIGAAADQGVVVSAIGGDCPSLAVSSIDGTPRATPPEWGDCQIGFINDVAVSGGFVYTIEDGDGRNLVQRDLATGEMSTTPIGDAWSLATLPDGTVGVGGTDIVVGRFEAGVFVEASRMPASTSFTLARVDGFPPDATLGSGSGQLPCTPMELPPVAPQGLPQAVEDKRSIIFDMAAACDMEGLADMALADGAAFSFGAETDPLRSWIRSARNGFDVMAWIVRLFNSTPAVDGARTYAWPAVHVTNAEEDWQELSGILSAAEFEQYSLYRDSGWLGLRIGIAEDGTWRYVVAGD